MSRDIAALLTDYSSRDRVERSLVPYLKRVKAPVAVQPKEVPAARPDDHSEAIASAVATARQEEREAARRALEEHLTAERVRHEEALKAERQRWAEAEGRALSSRIGEAIEALEERLAGSMANVLKPFIARTYREAAIADLRRNVATILSGTGAPTLRITAPEDILEHLRTGLQGFGGLVEFAVGNDGNAVVVAGETMIQAQLGSWLSRLDSLGEAE